MFNITCDGVSFSSGSSVADGEELVQQKVLLNQNQVYGNSPNSLPLTTIHNNGSPTPEQIQPPAKKKRHMLGNPEVIALSPSSLMATNQLVCEHCNKGFQREQNLQLHKRVHNLPWKLKVGSSNENRKKVYVCPEASCVHHDPARGLVDLSSIKKHFARKHCEKKLECSNCSKKYAVQSDFKAHLKFCSTKKEYECECGILFTRKNRFYSHKAICDALAEKDLQAARQELMASMVPDHPEENLISSLPIQYCSNSNNGFSSQPWMSSGSSVLAQDQLLIMQNHPPKPLLNYLPADGGHGHLQQHDIAGFHKFQLDQGGGGDCYLPTGLSSKFGGEIMTAVDCFGTAGSSRPRGINLHDHHHQQQQQVNQEMEFNGGIGDPMMQGLNQFHQCTN